MQSRFSHLSTILPRSATPSLHLAAVDGDGGSHSIAAYLKTWQSEEHFSAFHQRITHKNAFNPVRVSEGFQHTGIQGERESCGQGQVLCYGRGKVSRRRATGYESRAGSGWDVMGDRLARGTEPSRTPNSRPGAKARHLQWVSLLLAPFCAHELASGVCSLLDLSGCPVKARGWESWSPKRVQIWVLPLASMSRRQGYENLCPKGHLPQVHRAWNF